MKNLANQLKQVIDTRFYSIDVDEGVIEITPKNKKCICNLIEIVQFATSNSLKVMVNADKSTPIIDLYKL